MSSGGGGARVRVAREGTDTERHILPGVVPPQEALDILSVIQKLPKRPDSGEPCWAVVGNLVRRDWRTCRRVWLAAQEGQGLQRAGSCAARPPFRGCISRTFRRGGHCGGFASLVGVRAWFRPLKTKREVFLAAHTAVRRRSARASRICICRNLSLLRKRTLASRRCPRARCIVRL